MIDWTPLWLTFRLAIITTSILLIIGIPTGYYLANTQHRIKVVLQSIISLPLVLPPTVLGFYLLIAFSPSSPLGKWLDRLFDVQLVFTFEGLVVASLVYSFPFMVNPIQSGFEALPAVLSEASLSLGKSQWTTFWRVLLPNNFPALVTGGVFSFAHTVGEFGVILMIGGSIPGETRVASIAIYNEVEALNYQTAHTYAAILLGITFLILLLTHLINRRYLRKV
jgi:molybdate transport system permease protein